MQSEIQTVLTPPPHVHFIVLKQPGKKGSEQPPPPLQSIKLSSGQSTRRKPQIKADCMCTVIGQSTKRKPQLKSRLHVHSQWPVNKLKRKPQLKAGGMYTVSGQSTKKKQQLQAGCMYTVKK